MTTNDLINIDPELMSGTPVFRGTRVPIRTLFEYIEGGYSLNEFLDCFPSVTREMAVALLERSETLALENASR